MITSVIGKLFLDAYNEKNGTKYDAKTFFAEVFYPLFFGSPKYLMWVQNSPFVQGLKTDKWTTEEGQKRLEQLFQKVEDGAKDASVALGYPASEEKEFATTSGQVTSMPVKPTSDEIYLSWIGASMGVGVTGGISILFSDKSILLDIYEGLKLYRKALNTTNILKGNQCSTWNAQWLAHRYSREYSKERPMANFNPFETSGGVMKVGMQTWTKVLIGISREYKEPRMMSYIYSFGQMNKTIGFIPFLLDEIRRPCDFYKKMFNMESTSAEALYGTSKDLMTYSQSGVIGLKAMEPKGMEEFIRGEKIPTCDKKNEEKLISFRTYQIWILAMLNNQDFWDKSLAFAEAIRKYETSDKALSKKRANAVAEILKATNKKNFIEALTFVVGEAENKEQIVAIASEVNTMPTDNVPYFLTLVRFQYASIK
ncbi:MAG: hypothetical protein J6I79_00645 [Paludibacteraceae bacterium]|nr:hypothetical protein [Paludibacteraceae bacterium]